MRTSFKIILIVLALIPLFFGIWSVLVDIDQRGTVFRLLVLTIFIGGLARLSLLFGTEC